MDVAALQDWAARATEALTDIADEAQRSSGQGAAPDLRALAEEYHDIRGGRPTWKARCKATPAERTLLDEL